MMAIFIAHGSIDLNAQYAEGNDRQKIDNNKKVLERHRKTFGAQLNPADTEKEKSIRKQVTFQTSAERRRGICCPDCLRQSIPELGGRVTESSETTLLFGVFFSSTWDGQHNGKTQCRKGDAARTTH